jgi:hypothetical protein
MDNSIYGDVAISAKEFIYKAAKDLKDSNIDEEEFLLNTLIIMMASSITRNSCTHNGNITEDILNEIKRLVAAFNQEEYK